MTSSKKHKKERAADFHKKKLRVGKPKTSTRLTNPDIKSKTVVVNQKLINRPAELTTSQREAFAAEHSLTLLRHHQAQQRKDALNNLTNYYSCHKKELNQSLAQLFRACMPLVCDESSQVREALFSLLDRVFPTPVAQASKNKSAQNSCTPYSAAFGDNNVIPEQNILILKSERAEGHEDEPKLALHMSTALLWAHSAMTSINEQVRQDSTRLIRWVLVSSPSSVLDLQEQTWACFDTLIGLTKTSRPEQKHSALSQLLSGGSRNREAQCRHIETFARWIAFCCSQILLDGRNVVPSNLSKVIHPEFWLWVDLSHANDNNVFADDDNQNDYERIKFFCMRFPQCKEFLLSAWKEAYALVRSREIQRNILEPKIVSESKSDALRRAKRGKQSSQDLPVRVLISIWSIFQCSYNVCRADAKVLDDEFLDEGSVRTLRIAVKDLETQIMKDVKQLRQSSHMQGTDLAYALAMQNENMLMNGLANNSKKKTSHYEPSVKQSSNDTQSQNSSNVKG